MTVLKLVARSQLYHAESIAFVQVHLLPWGDILACLTPLRTTRTGGSSDYTAIDLWSIRNPGNPREVLRMRTKTGYVVHECTLQETESIAVGRLVLVCRSSYESADRGQCFVECYDVDLTDREPTLLGVEPQYERILSESRHLIPPYPQMGSTSTSSPNFEFLLEFAGNVVSCTTRDHERPRGEHDESSGPYSEQFNPEIPLPGFEQVYLLHLSNYVGRWLHPRHCASYISVQAYIHDDSLYLLGRTPSTFVVQKYHFSEDMLQQPTDALHAIDFLDLGSPLAECESITLPYPYLPFGSCDHQMVHFDPIYGFTILQLQDWSAGEGQVMHLPLPRRGEPIPKSTVLALAAPHLPDKSYFGHASLGRNHVVIYSEDDDDSSFDAFFRLTFDFGTKSSDLAPTNGLPETAALVIRDDLAGAADGDVEDLWSMRRPFAVDERSGRVCLAKWLARDRTELFVFSLKDD